MQELLAFTIVGLVTGCIYAMTATGLVVTYTTTGIFNFAHGAVGMISAFMFWQLWQGWHVNVFLSLVLVLGVLAPAFGVLIERVLMRPLYGAPVDITVVVTLGLLLALVGLANIIWSPGEQRLLPQFFNGSGFRAGQVLVTYHQLITVAVAVGIALGLRVLFGGTRTGIAMRAVVDNPDLLAMAGGRPIRIQQLAWALGSSLAAVAGILLAPLAQLDILLLTLLVVNGYAAAMIGRLRALPATVIGALLIGLGQRYALGYAPGSGFLSKIQNVIPMFVLFVVLIVLKQDRLRTATFAGAVAPRVASLRSSLAWGGVLVVSAFVLSQVLGDVNIRTATNGVALGLVLLSLVLLTGYGGMVSLGQMAFVGIGAFSMGKLGGGGSLVGIVAAVVISAVIGGLIALPTLKLRGLYLALATFAFATVMDQAVFVQAFGTGGALQVDRPKLPGIPTQSDGAFLVFCAAVFALVSIGLLALRRSSFGRRLVALNDSPAACATLGVNINNTKLITFAMASGLAGLGGALYGGVPGQVSPLDFAALLSLVVLLLARVGGINTCTGALLGAMTFALFPVLQKAVPSLANLQYLLTGLAAIAVGRDPNGLGGRIAGIAEQLRSRFSPPPPPRVVAAQPGSTGAIFLEEEGDSLVGAGR